MPSVTCDPWIRIEAAHDRYLPESPRALRFEERPALVWVNIQTGPDAPAGAVHLAFLDTGERRIWPQIGRPGFLVPTDRPGVVVLGQDSTLGAFDLAHGIWEPWASIPDDPSRVIINDAEVLPGGRAILFGTKDLQATSPIASLYLFTLDDRHITRLSNEQICSNGKVIERDARGLMLYDIDTPTRCVNRYRLDLEHRALRDECTALDLRDQAGYPDGMISGGEGSVIVAFYNPEPVDFGRAVQFDLFTGVVVHEWRTPGAPRVTCPLLLPRPNGVDLVLTTAAEGMPSDHQARCPDAGQIFLGPTDFDEAPAVEIVRGLAS